MPAAYLMTWEPRTRRWFKMIRGKRYVVSCRQLTEWAGKLVPETKDGSYQVANDWWAAKRAEIDSVGASPPHPQATYLKALKRRQEWSEEYGLVDKADAFDAEIERVKAGGEVRTPQVPAWKLEAWEVEDGPFLEEEDLADDSPVWRHRLSPKEEAAPTVPLEKTIGGLLDRFLELERGRVRAGSLTVAAYEHSRLCLTALRGWAGEGFAIERFDAGRWEDFFSHLSGLQESADYRKAKLRHSRTFLAWCGERGAFQPPGNLYSRRLQIKLTPKAVVTFSVAEVHELLSKATDQTRLFVLLMLNCGAYESDISALRQGEVDWNQGRIRRKRSKTRGVSHNVPEVDYKLWGPTFELLQQFRSSDPERVLVTSKGKPFLLDALDPETGKRKRTDTIKSAWSRMMKQVNKGRPDGAALTKPLKALRKTSATLLESHPTYGRYVPHFLGHSPRGMAALHYSAPSKELFDQAVKWLGEAFGC